MLFLTTTSAHTHRQRQRQRERGGKVGDRMYSLLITQPPEKIDGTSRLLCVQQQQQQQQPFPPSLFPSVTLPFSYQSLIIPLIDVVCRQVFLDEFYFLLLLSVCWWSVCHCFTVAALNVTEMSDKWLTFLRTRFLFYSHSITIQRCSFIVSSVQPEIDFCFRKFSFLITSIPIIYSWNNLDLFLFLAGNWHGYYRNAL